MKSEQKILLVKCAFFNLQIAPRIQGRKDNFTYIRENLFQDQSL